MDKSSKKDKKKHKKSSSSSKRERERSSAERPQRDEKRGRREHGRGGRTDTDYRKRPREAQGNGHGDTNGHGVNNGGGGQQRPHLSASKPQAWLRPNIRVRVVRKSYARAYLGKGRVVDVPRIGQATVRMDLGDLVLEGAWVCCVAASAKSVSKPMVPARGCASFCFLESTRRSEVFARVAPPFFFQGRF